MPLSHTNLAPRVGTEIKADRETLLKGSEAPSIRRLLEERGAIVFPQVNFDDQELRAFSRTIGDLFLERQGDEGVFKVTMDEKLNKMAEYVRGAVFWHIDGTTDDVPSRASMLCAKRLANEGGQTEVANTYAAWDDLPEAKKQKLQGLRVVHTLESIQRLIYPDPTEAQLAFWQSIPSKSHPLVWTHQSGRKSIVLGATASHIEGMDIEEGRALIKELMEWSTKPDYVYRHEWTLGDLLIWDNTGTMHRAVPYPLDSGRMMHRTTLVGEEPLV
jgi:alpha-ketoglutarate-dependent taurine dioxygenase